MLSLPRTYKKPTNNFHGHCFARNILCLHPLRHRCAHTVEFEAVGRRSSMWVTITLQTRPGFGAVMIHECKCGALGPQPRVSARGQVPVMAVVAGMGHMSFSHHAVSVEMFCVGVRLKKHSTAYLRQGCVYSSSLVITIITTTDFHWMCLTSRNTDKTFCGQLINCPRRYDGGHGSGRRWRRTANTVCCLRSARRK